MGSPIGVIVLLTKFGLEVQGLVKHQTKKSVYSTPEYTDFFGSCGKAMTRNQFKAIRSCIRFSNQSEKDVDNHPVTNTVPFRWRLVQDYVDT